MNVKKQFRNCLLRNCAAIMLVCNAKTWYFPRNRQTTENKQEEDSMKKLFVLIFSREDTV